MPELRISAVLPADILPLYHAIPEFDTPFGPAEIDQRLAHRPVCALIAYSGGKPAGFKLGYGTEPELFYSWLGGVLPAYRQSGIAQRLLVAQEQWARAEGYHRLQVKTRNSFPGMLQLLIKNRYYVIGLEKKGPPLEYRLLLEKALHQQETVRVTGVIPRPCPG